MADATREATFIAVERVRAVTERFEQAAATNASRIQACLPMGFGEGARPDRELLSAARRRAVHGALLLMQPEL